MGTKALIAFASRVNTHHYTRILGMASDGFPTNLRGTAENALAITRELGKANGYSLDTVRAVQDALVAESDGFLFVDEIRNADWVSYSARVDLVTGEITLYHGILDTPLTPEEEQSSPGARRRRAGAR